MNTDPTSRLDPTTDFIELGLMEAASPEFAEAMVRALLAAGEGSEAPAGAAGSQKNAAA
jgi:hypothetical protein